MMDVESVVDRELLGISKASLLQLRTQLGQYVQQAHTAQQQRTQAQLNLLLVYAVNELCAADDTYLLPLMDMNAATQPAADTHADVMNTMSDDAMRLDGSASCEPAAADDPADESGQQSPSAIQSLPVEQQHAPQALAAVKTEAVTPCSATAAIGLLCSSQASTSRRPSRDDQPLTDSDGTAVELDDAGGTSTSQPHYSSSSAQPGSSPATDGLYSLPPLPGSSLHRCALCPRVFLNSNGLNRHVSYMHKHRTQKTIRCYYCPYKSAESSNVRRHLERTHRQKEPKFTCPICMFTSFEAPTIRKHMLDEHKNADHASCS